MAKTRLGEPLRNADGTFTIIFNDGSTMVINSYGQVMPGGNDSPNPLLAATMGAGDEEGARRRVEAVDNENARRFNANLANQNAQVTNQYKLGMMNARTQQEQLAVTREYQQAQTELAKQRLAFDERTQQQNFGMQQSTLAKGMIDTAAQLSGPDNLFEAYDLNRGYGAMQETPGFLQALRDNTQLRAFGAQGGAPDPKTLDSVMAKMQPGYANSAEARTTENALGTIADIGAAGAHRIGAGQLESLNASEMGSFMSGIGKSGFDRNAFLSDWRKSRIGQGIGARRAA